MFAEVQKPPFQLHSSNLLFFLSYIAEREPQTQAADRITRQPGGARALFLQAEAGGRLWEFLRLGNG